MLISAAARIPILFNKVSPAPLLAGDNEEFLIGRLEYPEVDSPIQISLVILSKLHGLHELRPDTTKGKKDWANAPPLLELGDLFHKCPSEGPNTLLCRD